MDFYHSWIYMNILNTKWFMWSVVVGVFGFNFLGAVFTWLAINSKGVSGDDGAKEDHGIGDE